MEFHELQSQMANLRQSQQHAENPQEQMLRNETYKPEPLSVRFFIDAVRDDRASSEGCPIYKEHVFVYIKIMDAGGDAISVEATQEHIERYPREYALFQRSMANQSLSLSLLPQMRPAVLRAFKELGVASVDDVIAKPLPEYLQKYRQMAVDIKAVHDRAAGKIKRGRKPKAVV